jgi:hypothetical protein
MAETKKGVIVNTDNNNINNGHSHSPHYHSPNNYMNDYTKYWFNNAGALSRRSVENVPIFVIILFTAFFFISMIYYFSTVYATAGVVVEKQIVHNRYSNPSFGIKSIDFPQGWTGTEIIAGNNTSLVLKFVISSGFTELGASDFSTMVLTAITNKPSAMISTGDGKNENVSTTAQSDIQSLLLHDEKDCKLLEKSSSLIDNKNFSVFEIGCGSFKYKSYQTTVDNTKISLTYSSLQSAFGRRLSEFDKAAHTLVLMK